MPKRISNRRKEMGEEAWTEYQAQRNRDKVRKYLNTRKVVQSRIRKKRKLIDYKGGKCERCGLESEVNGVYVFHHRNPEEKEFRISGVQNSFEACRVEVDKCDLLCQNCHAIVHWEWDKNKIIPV